MTDAEKKKRLTEARAGLGARMDDYQPRVTTPVVRQELPNGSWRVLRASFPPVILAENVTEQEAIDAQTEERERLGQIVNAD